MPNYDSPLSLQAFLDESGLAMTKRFSQNFLIDHSARERLVESISASEGSLIWEIGPGLGSLTSLLLETGCSVMAFEIDHGFSRALRGFFGEYARFTLVEGDFLKTWKEAGPAPDRIFGNLPYNAALAIIASLLEGGLLSERMIFTVQKEAAQRIAASPGTKDYSAFSVLCSSVCKIKLLYDIGASSFWPRPKVTSSVVVMSPRPNPLAAHDRLGFSNFVRSGFASRRKTLKNNLLTWIPYSGPATSNGKRPVPHSFDIGALSHALEAIRVPPDVRAEALTPEQLFAVYTELKTSS
jgi:16S rRNA (adenine1518-N6/adenine1519-N6)-dimethyltransferase